MDWADFFAMGGHATYVWGSYGVMFALIFVELILVRKRKGTLIQRLRRIQKIEEITGNNNETKT